MTNCILCKKEISCGQKCGSCISNNRRFAIKIAAVASKGGSCILCGFKDCLQSLTFHHLDPDSKSFDISGSHCKSEKLIEEELKKCVLLCQNCHHGIHAGVYSLVGQLDKNIDLPFNYSTKLPKKERVLRDNLAQAGKNRRIFEISKEDLEKLLLEMSMEKIGIKLGVSGSAIKKRAKKLGITNFPGRGYWAKQRNLG